MQKKWKRITKLVKEIPTNNTNGNEGKCISIYKHEKQYRNTHLCQVFMCSFVFLQLCAYLFIHVSGNIYLFCYFGSSGLPHTQFIPCYECSFAWKKFKWKQKEAHKSPVLCVWVGVVMFSFVHVFPVITSLCVLTSLSDAAPCVYNELVLQFGIALLLPQHNYKNTCRALFWAS